MCESTSCKLALAQVEVMASWLLTSGKAFPVFPVPQALRPKGGKGKAPAPSGKTSSRELGALQGLRWNVRHGGAAG
ncbi:hypothetical protein CA264_16415 [Pontibacter actiniarum]|uniref:Uncharacterized protein n=1 Tax=Pontibacter actiniarum TaxID=323450 RepID=A0A1X9YVG8_9BACT|nr:hypothetical protein CA264_16415 [Pontibacter actiniarum]